MRTEASDKLLVGHGSVSLGISHRKSTNFAKCLFPRRSNAINEIRLTQRQCYFMVRAMDNDDAFSLLPPDACVVLICALGILAALLWGAP